jgi:hypothetical protein
MEALAGVVYSCSTLTGEWRPTVLLFTTSMSELKKYNIKFALVKSDRKYFDNKNSCCELKNPP